MTHKFFLTSALFLLAQSIGHAQEAVAPPVTPSEFVNNTVMLMIGAVLLVLILAFLLLLYNNAQLVQTIYYMNNPEAAAKKAEAKQAVKEPGILHKLYTSLITGKRVKTEAELLLDHDYDGIRELDNKMPPWWVYGFYCTIIFAGIYLYRYVVSDDWSSKKQYEQEMAVAAEAKAANLAKEHNGVDETSVARLTDAASISEGKKVFTDKCVTCHGANGEGVVGPNLTDEYWLHGGSINDIFKTIKYGVPQKGMLTWNGQLTPLQIQQVASFVMSLQGTNPPNAKAPQGDKYIPVTDTTTKATTDTTNKKVTTAAKP